MINKIVRWLIFSLPTTLGYTVECFGFPRIALFIFTPLANAGYPPAMHHLGSLLMDFMHDNHDPVKGFEWHQKAAEAGYKPSQEVLNIFKDQKPGFDSGKILRGVFEQLESPWIKTWKKVRPIVWSAWLIWVALSVLKHFGII